MSVMLTDHALRAELRRFRRSGLRIPHCQFVADGDGPHRNAWRYDTYGRQQLNHKDVDGSN